MSRFRLEWNGGVARVSFDDGGMNLLSRAALEELREAIAEASGCSLLVFESGRPGLFAAGADMAEMLRFTPHEAAEFARLGQEVFASIEQMACVTVAAIDGDCFGGALDLILAFDLRFATRRSRFAHPGARLGIVTGFGGTSRWRSVLSRPSANQLFLANRLFDAEEAASVGLVDGLGPVGEREIARLSSAERRRTQMVKQLTRSAATATRGDLLSAARRLEAIYSTGSVR